jgi:hypothetical protein
MTLRIVNKIILWLLIGLCFLTVIGLLNFGHGLGNIVYFPPIILATLGHIIITGRLTKRNNNKYWLPIIVTSLLVCLSIIYKATIGRGAEFSWNGEIFFIK